MKLTKMPKVVIRNRVPGHALTGGNTEVYIDGKMFGGIQKLELTIRADAPAVLNLTMIADVELEETEIESNFMKELGKL